jgi:UDP-N-acetylmuramyl pentapeptide phosphotransferase/UDP-N-acetylglucosamine-1-phosphate transferase
LINLFLTGGIFLLGVTLFALLYWQAKGQRGPFWRYFYVPARKSTTNAIQFGGLPLSILLMMIPWVVKAFYPLPILMHKLMPWMALSQTLVIIYGYLDDKYELRPIFKLFFQFISVIVFSLVASAKIHPSFSSLAFMIMFVVGMGMINGSNLLDGLDTLTIKFSSVQLMMLALLPQLFPSSMADTMTIMALMGLMAVWSFYPFNREPAKIHLGEIGGPSIGLFCFYLSTLVFAQVEEASSIKRASVSLLPLALPIVELAVSFLRRLYNKKRPFKGDQLHVHHLLKNMHAFGPSHTSSIMAAVYLFTSAISVAIAFWLSQPFLGLLAQYCGLTFFYFMVGRKYWSGSDTLEISARSLFNYIRKKDVMLIETSMIDNFEITIMNKEDIEKMKQDYENNRHAKPENSSEVVDPDDIEKAS